MKDASPQPIHLSDYRQPEFWIPNVELHFTLGAGGGPTTIVRSKLTLQRNLSLASKRPLVLNGEKLKLLSVAVDGTKRLEGEYTLTDTTLTLENLPDSCSLEIVVEIEPEKNLSCEGLYKSGGFYCTQCEAESFRRITYFLDRPDVMSVYQVTIDADKAEFPQLLSNGNPVASRDLPGGRHEVVWKDPSKKPCYLFALVAGNMGVLEDSFTTRSGRKVKLQIFGRHGLESRFQHAMDSLKWSMKWDEDTYGLEYDLDIFMIFVAEEFNMGAMENKGLNIFNAGYVLANPETATDADYDGITAVVGHEYFHNWTGNRVTCRDWFQLSLKEGLTVFRDQRFSADHGSEAVNRLEDVTRLRTAQFAEDAGPMAHPIRPQSYITIDNFYTTTIYEKGAEVIRMIETIVGRDGFRRGMDLYFERHDGQAVTTEDFVAAMADANEVDLTQFRDSWYNQPGTPHVTVKTDFNPAKQTFAVTLCQYSKPSPGFPTKMPYHIPVAVGLLDRSGKEMPLQLTASGRQSSGEGQTTLILHLREPQQTFIFEGVREKPTMSFLRKFSAPVKVEWDRSDEELAFVMANDPDSFSRWEAAQTLTIHMVKALCEDQSAGKKMREPSALVRCFGPILADETIDADFKSYLFALPSEQYLSQFFEIVDVDHIHAAREHIKTAIVTAYRPQMTALFDRLAKAGTEGRSPDRVGFRSLRSRLLDYLVIGDDAGALERAAQQRQNAKNMTDEIGALQALSRSQSPVRTRELQAFYTKWKHEPLVMNKWLMIQAIAPVPTALDDVRRLSQDPIFDKNNPNKIYSLYRAFAQMNAIHFNARSGSGYKFIADQIIEIDSRNPQVASRLATSFNQWRTLDSARQELVKTELKRVLATTGLSSNVYEIVSKYLAN